MRLEHGEKVVVEEPVLRFYLQKDNKGHLRLRACHDRSGTDKILLEIFNTGIVRVVEGSDLPGEFEFDRHGQLVVCRTIYEDYEKLSGGADLGSH